MSEDNRSGVFAGVVLLVLALEGRLTLDAAYANALIAGLEATIARRASSKPGAGMAIGTQRPAVGLRPAG